jgi:hypothetical protein
MSLFTENTPLVSVQDTHHESLNITHTMSLRIEHTQIVSGLDTHHESLNITHTMSLRTRGNSMSLSTEHTP